MNDWNDVRVEIEDMNWGIKVANWCANLACDLVDETVVDTISNKTTSAVMAVLTSLGGRATMTQLTRSLRSIDAPQIRASVNDLEKSGKVSVRKEATSGRSKVWVEVQ
jgi:DNA-binding HxlR family transcriptional regulator